VPAFEMQGFVGGKKPVIKVTNRDKEEAKERKHTQKNYSVLVREMFPPDLSVVIEELSPSKAAHKTANSADQEQEEEEFVVVEGRLSSPLIHTPAQPYMSPLPKEKKPRARRLDFLDEDLYSRGDARQPTHFEQLQQFFDTKEQDILRKLERLEMKEKMVQENILTNVQDTHSLLHKLKMLRE